MIYMTETKKPTKKAKDRKIRCKMETERKGLGCAFSFREKQLFQLVSTTYFSSLPPPILYKPAKLLIVFNNPVPDTISTISLLKLLLLLALICPDCSSPPRSRARARAPEFLASCHECKQRNHTVSPHWLTSDAFAYNTS